MADPRRYPGLKSPLIERNEAEPTPGVISLENYGLCNDAALGPDQQFTVSMPARQWSYGVLLPLHHDALPPEVTDLAVRLGLSVRHGSIGVAGVDATLTKLTTAERIVGVGETVLALTIPNATDTHAVVLRTISTDGPRPEVTIRQLASYRAGGVRLSARQHDLGYDLFVVLSMQKTATQTVEQTLLSCHPTVQVRRTHFISSDSISSTRQMAQAAYYSDYSDEFRESLLFQAECAEKLAQEIAFVTDSGGKLALLSGVREPIGRTVAAVFQAIPATFPGFAQFKTTSAGELIELFAHHITHRLRRIVNQHPTVLPWEQFHSFFQDELTAAAGIDILATSFDRDRGFTLIADENRSLLLYRFEDAGPKLAAALAALTGRENIELVNTNLSTEKSYAEFYKEFLARFKVPRDICAAIYDDPYVRHFYSEADIKAFKAKWQRKIFWW